MQFQLIEDLTNQVIQLSESWEGQEFGKLSTWFKLFYIINNLVKENKTATQIDKITLALDVIEHFANRYANKYRMNLSEKDREILDIFVNGEGASVLQASNDFIQDILKKIDTNNDGKISGRECKHFFCCLKPNEGE